MRIGSPDFGGCAPLCGGTLCCRHAVSISPLPSKLQCYPSHLRCHCIANISIDTKIWTCKTQGAQYRSYPEAEVLDAVYVQDATQGRARAARLLADNDMEPETEKQLRKHSRPHGQQGFKTGIDLYAPEEQAKREQRAARFATGVLGDQAYVPLVDEDEAKKRERAARFGTTYTAVDQSGLENQDLLEERRDHGAAVERRADTIYLYGVDRMSTRDCLQYFEDYGPSLVEWLDDSSCNVVFGDGDSAKRAVVGMGRPFGPGEASDLKGLNLCDMDNLPFLWHKGKDFWLAREKGSDQGNPIPLIFRMATVDDKKGATVVKTSRHLWRGRASGNPEGRMKRRMIELDDDGDVVMAANMKQRKARGGKRARRKRQKGGNGADIEMKDAEDFEEQPEMPVVSTTTENDDMQPQPDLRGVLSGKQTMRSQSSHFRMFSARDAGVVGSMDGTPGVSNLQDVPPTTE